MTNLLHPLGNRNRFLPKIVCKFGATFLLLLLSATAFAQQATITGKILDERSKEPVLGSNIKVKGTSSGTTTDANGNFSVKVKELPATLLITSVDYKNQEIDVYEAVPTTIYLTEDLNRLNSVVVVGYGTQKRSELTGSIASVNTESLKRNPVSSIDNALQGATSGLRVSQTSGQPGGGVSLRLRGGSSIQGGNEPLYVVDGFPFYNSSASAGTASGANVNPLSAINPGDIESIDILKDAAATAIYGSRGANGVVIITTKRGKSEKPVVNYDYSYGSQSLRKKIELLNAKQFASLRNDALYDSNPTGGTNQYLSQAAIDALGEGTDWQAAAFRTAAVQNHQLNISGGNAKTRYLVSANYFNQDGIIINTGFNRFSSRVNLDAQVSDRFKLGVSLTASKSEADVAPSGVVSALLTMPPTATIYEANGTYTLRNPFENILSNPIASLNEQTNHTKDYRALANVFGEYSLLDGLVLKVAFGTDILNRKEYSYVPSNIYEGSTNGGSASLGSLQSESWLNENTLTYDKDIAQKHHLNVLAGFTQQQFRNESFTAGSYKYVSDDLLYNSLQSGSSVTSPTSNTSQSVLQSLLGRVNYSYDKKYYVTASLRGDGSSRFGKNNKWGYFPSAGFSWYASNEEFFKPLTKVVNDLKVRTSIGKTGNQEIGNYKSLATLSSVKYLFNNTLVTGFTTDRIANDNLGWESTLQTDAGVDVGLLNNRVNVSADVYRKLTTDLLLNVEIPWTTGQSTSLQNYGSVENKGFELQVNTKNLQGALNWNTNVNFSLNRNKVLKIGGSSKQYISGNYIVKVGEPLGSFYGSVTDGILQADEVATKGKYTGNATPKPGDRLYKDFSGDSTFTTANDRTIIGNAQPDFEFGVNNSFEYKGFDLSFFVQGSIGNQILNGNKQTLELFNGQQNASISAVDRWTATNPSTTIPRAKLDPAPVFSDRYIEDGSFIRLKNASFGYTLPKNLLPKSLGISKLRVYLSGSNLLTWTKYTGFDPEVTSGDNTVSQGSDSGIYPIARTITAGVSITL